MNDDNHNPSFPLIGKETCMSYWGGEGGLSHGCTLRLPMQREVNKVQCNVWSKGRKIIWLLFDKLKRLEPNRFTPTSIYKCPIETRTRTFGTVGVWAFASWFVQDAERDLKQAATPFYYDTLNLQLGNKLWDFHCKWLIMKVHKFNLDLSELWERNTKWTPLQRLILRRLAATPGHQLEKQSSQSERGI